MVNSTSNMPLLLFLFNMLAIHANVTLLVNQPMSRPFLNRTIVIKDAQQYQDAQQKRYVLARWQIALITFELLFCYSAFSWEPNFAS